MVDVAATGTPVSQLVDRLAARGVLTGAIDSRTVRLVTHRDVNRADCEQAVRIIAEVIGAGY